MVTHGHVIENDTVHTAPNCCHWCQFDSLSGSRPRNNGCRSFVFFYGHSTHSIDSVCTLCSLHVESACHVEFECFACSFVGALPCSHIGHTKSRNRSKNLGISPHMYTSQLFPITMRGIRQDAVSPTRPETAVVFRVRSCLCWFYCHISRKT